MEPEADQTKPAGEQTPGTPAAPAAPAPEATGTPAAPAAPAPEAQAEKTYTAAELQSAIEEAQTAGTQAAAVAAQTARDELIQKFGRDLGLIKDEDKAPDVDALTSRISTEQAKAKRAQVELAVTRKAAKAGGDPEALLDSTAFLKAAKGLDPDADDFDTAVESAITAAVAANPKLSAAPVVPGRSGGDPSKGDAESNGQLTEAQFAKLPAAERLAAHKAGRTRNFTRR